MPDNKILSKVPYDDIVNIKQQSLYARLKRLFATDVIVRNVGGKKLKIKDSDEIMYATDRNSLRDRFNRVRSTAYNAYTRDFALSYQAARLDLFRDYDTMDMDPIISSALDIYPDECLSGETIIPLLDGSKKTIESIFKEKLTNFWVYSMDEHGNFCPKLCERVAYNGKKKMLKIGLDDGTEIKCTPNHIWVKSDNNQVFASDLNVGDSLKTFSIKLSESEFMAGYEMLLDGDGKWKYTHRLVANSVNKLINEKLKLNSKNKIIHHTSFDKKNNSPDFLKRVDYFEHKKIHSGFNKLLWSDPTKTHEYKEKTINGHKKYWTYENRKKASEKQKLFIKNYISTLSENELKLKFGRSGRQNGMFGKRYKLEKNKNGRWKNFSNIDVINLIEYESDIINGLSASLLRKKYNLNSFDSKTLNKQICKKYNIYRICQLKNKLKLDKLYSGLSIPLIKFYAKNEMCNGINIFRNISTISKKFNVTNKQLFDFIIKSGYKGIKDLVNSNNHRIIYIEQLNEEYDSYDLVNVGNSTHLYAIECKDGSKLITHNCLTENELGEVLTIDSKNNNIKDILYNLFYDILNIEFNLWSWIRNVCKYGDFYLKLNISPEYGVYLVEPMSAYNVERIENSDPLNKNYVKFQVRPVDTSQAEILESFQVAHFRLLSDSNFLPYGKCLSSNTCVWTTNGPKLIKDIETGDVVYSFDFVNNTTVKGKVLNKIMSGIQKTYEIKTEHRSIYATFEHPFMIKDGSFKCVKDLTVNDCLVLPEIGDDSKIVDENVKANNSYHIEKIRSIKDHIKEDVYDIQVDNNLHNFIANGIVVHNSMIEPARRVWKQLSLLEDAMLIHRIMRAPEKRIFKIDIGNIPPNEVDNFMEQIISKMKKIPYVDENTGDYNLRFNLQNMVEDFYLPVRGNDSGASIDTLPGMEFTGIDDLEYVKNKMMAALKIPKAFLGYEEGLGKATLSSEDVRFSRTISRLQKMIISELNKIAQVHLYAQGYRDASIVDFTLGLTSPSTIFEKEKMEIWASKIENAKLMSEMSDSSGPFFSRNFVYKKIFRMSDVDIQKNQHDIIEDCKQLWRLKQITGEGNDPAKPFTKINPNAGKEGGPEGGPPEGGSDLGGLGELGRGPMGGSEGGLPNIEKTGEAGGGGEGGPPTKPMKETKIVEKHGEPADDYVRPPQDGKKDTNDYPFGEDPLGKLENERDPDRSITNKIQKESEFKKLSDFLTSGSGSSETKDLLKESDNKSILDETNILE